MTILFSDVLCLFVTLFVLLWINIIFCKNLFIFFLNLEIFFGILSFMFAISNYYLNLTDGFLMYFAIISCTSVETAIVTIILLLIKNKYKNIKLNKIIKKC
ncbi:MAG: hypothetical protein ACG0KC_00920 [Enterobacteriaceae bacterium]